jgi:hypothetical protein
VTDGPAMGLRGYFTRGADGQVDGIEFSGRLSTKTNAGGDAR